MKMLTFCAVLLLCGLLPSSQSIGGLTDSSLVELDLNLLENTVGTTLGQGNLLDDIVGKTLGGRGGLLGNLLGGGDLLGNNGLLGTGLLGGNGGGIGGLLGLKIAAASPPKVSLTVSPPDGIGINVSTILTLQASLLGGQLLDLKVAANIMGRSRLVQDPNGQGKPALILASDDCKIQIKLVSSVAPGLFNTLTNVLDGLLSPLLCPVLNLVLNLLNSILTIGNGVLPLDGLGSVKYLLGEILQSNGDKLLMGLDMRLLDSSGNKVPLPPMEPLTLPPTQPGDHASRVLLNTEIISTLLQLLLEKGSLNTEITGEGSAPLTTSALLSVLPEGTVPANLPLEVSINVGETPLVTVDNGEIDVKLPLVASVSTQTDKGREPLFVVDANVDLKGGLKVTGGAVGIDLSLEDLSLGLSSSQIGNINVDLLKDWFTSILGRMYLPLINSNLGNLLPLPNVGNMGYASGAVDSVGNTIAVDLLPSAGK